MVVHQTKYMAQQEKKQHSKTLNCAKEIAMTILKYFSIYIYRQYDRFISNPSIDPFKKGD